ncbi:hypothetical protein PENSPDRAFT_425625 [Peniophora sp. CONT]|nr:hypothetical protein PENSPDRAFT_425625 [Peniophora sp. CONT]
MHEWHLHQARKGRHCHDCNSTTSRGWFRHLEILGAHHCRNCYKIARVKAAIAQDKKCHQCGAQPRVPIHHYPSVDGAILCNTCRRRNKVAKEVLRGRTCQSCGTNQTSAWRFGSDGASMCTYMRLVIRLQSRRGY